MTILEKISQNASNYPERIAYHKKNIPGGYKTKPDNMERT